VHTDGLFSYPGLPALAASTVRARLRASPRTISCCRVCTARSAISKPGCRAPTTASPPSTYRSTSTSTSSATTDAAPRWPASKHCSASAPGVRRQRIRGGPGDGASARSRAPSHRCDHRPDHPDGDQGAPPRVPRRARCGRRHARPPDGDRGGVRHRRRVRCGGPAARLGGAADRDLRVQRPAGDRRDADRPRARRADSRGSLDRRLRRHRRGGTFQTRRDDSAPAARGDGPDGRQPLDASHSRCQARRAQPRRGLPQHSRW